MFSRVLKSANSQGADPAPSPSKSRSNQVKSQSTAPPSPSKIPVPSSRSGHHSGAQAHSTSHTKENLPAVPQDANRSNYLSFLFPQGQQPGSGTSTPVKVNKVMQSSNPASTATHGAYTQSYVDEDVHMQTMKNTINPAMLKQLAAQPAPVSRSALPVLPPRSSEDIHMRTSKPETKSEKIRGLAPWEKELLESDEMRRKATVAQICEWT